MPRLPNCFASSFAASASSCGISVGSISMIVTSEPNRLKIDANSQPMIPPPRTTSRRGTSVWARRPVESTQRGESSPSIGGRSGNSRSRRSRCLKVTSSPPSTAIVFASVKRPAPLTHSTPFALKQARDAAGHLLDDARLPLVRRREVELRLADLDAELREASLGLLDRERGLHPRLRRDAADAQARAAELGLLLDADGLRAELRGADRGGVAARAAAQDGDVTFHRLLLVVPRSILCGDAALDAGSTRRGSRRRSCHGGCPADRHSRRPCRSRAETSRRTSGYDHDAEHSGSTLGSRPSRSRALEEHRGCRLGRSDCSTPSSAARAARRAALAEAAAAPARARRRSSARRLLVDEAKPGRLALGRAGTRRRRREPSSERDHRRSPRRPHPEHVPRERATSRPPDAPVVRVTQHVAQEPDVLRPPARRSARELLRELDAVAVGVVHVEEPHLARAARRRRRPRHRRPRSRSASALTSSTSMVATPPSSGSPSASAISIAPR